MRQYLIADSGGTKTDWCFIDVCKTKTYFTTKSYHPSCCDETFINSEIEFWTSHEYMMDADLLFFGAGCFNEQGRLTLEKTLQSIGFQNIKVRSDLDAAGIALFGESSGTVAILGTGSVVFDWKNQRVANITGGKGHLLGDEGSGFYFGKLVYEAFLQEKLSEEQKAVFDSVADGNEIAKAIKNNTHKFILGELSLKLQDYRLLFNSFHSRNAELFCETHFNSNNERDIAILGGYGYYHRDILKPIFQKCNHNVLKFLRRPIEVLVEQTVLLSD